MTLDQIVAILTYRISGLLEIKSLTLAEGGSEQQIYAIDEKIVTTQTTLENIISAINEA